MTDALDVALFAVFLIASIVAVVVVRDRVRRRYREPSEAKRRARALKRMNSQG